MGILKRWGGEQVGWEIIGMGASPSSTDITGVSSVAGKVGDVILDANDVKYDDSVTYDDTSIGYKIQQTLTVAEAVIVNLSTPYADVRNAVATNRVIFCDINNVRHYLSSVSQENGAITFISDTGAEISIVTYQDGVAASRITNRASTVFKAVYGTTTNAQIYAAKNQGNCCIVEYEGRNYVLGICSSAYANFTMTDLAPDGYTCRMVVCNNNDWHEATGVAPYIGTFNALSSTVSSHTTAINTLTSTVSSHQTTISSHTSAINTLTSTVSSHQTTISSHTTAINAVTSKANTNATNIATVTSKANTNANNITTVTNTANTNKTNITNLTTTVNGLTAAILKKAYPVGAYYWSTQSTSPASLFGGTWTQVSGRFILAAGGGYSAGGSGGEAWVTLALTQIPAHRHATYYQELAQNYSSGTKRRTASNAATESATEMEAGTSYAGGNNSGRVTAGSTSAHNNMPPYEVAYCWKRIS